VALLYADENFPFPVVQELRSLGHDVVTIQDRGLPSSKAGPGLLVSEVWLRRQPVPARSLCA
jgi:hypothetical protein